METPDEIRNAAIQGALKYLQIDACNDAVSSGYFKNVRQKLDEPTLQKMVKSRPDSTSGTALAKTLSAFGPGQIYKGRITLYKGFFNRFNIAIGTKETADSLGLSMDDRRIILFLHELSHVTRKYIDVLQIVGIHYFDEAIYDKCTINRRIYEACFVGRGKRSGDAVTG